MNEKAILTVIETLGTKLDQQSKALDLYSNSQIEANELIKDMKRDRTGHLGRISELERHLKNEQVLKENAFGRENKIVEERDSWKEEVGRLIKMLDEKDKEIEALKESKGRQTELLRDIQGLALEARTEKGLVEAEKIMELIFGNKPKEK
jgi:hypothetical protein